LMSTNHISDSDHREVGAISKTRSWINTCRTGAAITTAEDIGADNEVFFRIEKTPGANKARPPLCCICIGSQGMTYPDHIISAFVEPPVSKIDDLQFRQFCSGFQCKRLLRYQ